MIRKKSKQGQITLGSIPAVLLSLVFVAAIAVGGFLALNGLAGGASCPNLYTYNSASQTCELTSNTSITTSRTNAGNATVQIEGGMGNIFDQFATIGTLIGVGLLLAVIVVGFSVANRKGFI